MILILFELTFIYCQSFFVKHILFYNKNIGKYHIESHNEEMFTAHSQLKTPIIIASF